MKTTILFTLLLANIAAADPQTSVTLYQIGSKGRYCLSLTKEEGGCISGMDGGGAAINIVDVTKGKKVRFENLSDAPHDMKISGENAEDLPAQGPGAAAVNKEMAKEDRNKQSITCSFHGNQLGVGYRVLDDTAKGKQPSSEHRDRRNDLPMGDDANGGEMEGSRAIVRTGLADVSKDVLAKGRASDVAALLAGRPELMEDLKKVRPLLAEEIAANGGEAGSKDKLVAEKEGEGSDEDPYAAEFGGGQGAVNVDKLVALASGATGSDVATGAATEGGKNGAGRTGGAIGSGAGTDGIVMDDFAVRAGSGVAGSGGAKLGATAKVAAGVRGQRLLAAIGNPVIAVPDGHEKHSVFVDRVLQNKLGIARLFLLLLFVAAATRGLFFLLFAKRKEKKS